MTGQETHWVIGLLVGVAIISTVTLPVLGAIYYYNKIEEIRAKNDPH